MKNLPARLILGCVLFGGACSKNGTPATAAKPAGIDPSASAATATPPPALPPTPTAPPPAQVEEMGAVADSSKSISGKIVLPSARQGDVKKGDTMFLIARRAMGNVPGPPLAVQRLQAGDFPMPFSLSARDSMVPGIAFEGDVNITVRVDKDGDAMTRRKGDVFGQAASVKVGRQDVTLSLDTLQAEDVTLGGGMGMGGGHPGATGMAGSHPGLPPGHP
jgi:hypothetical protein